MANIDGTNNSETIRGTSGNDRIGTLNGNDTVYAGDGDDQINGTPGANGSYSYDIVTGSKTIYGEAGNDFIVGSTGNDTLDGGLGNDRILSRGGNDVINGGDGDDQINAFVEADGSVSYYEFAGNINVVGGAGNDAIRGALGSDKIDGGDGNDDLSGLAGDDLISGGSGNDKLYGNDGNDTLDGGSGADQLDGGAGNDHYIVDNLSDSINDNQGSNTGTINVDFYKQDPSIKWTFGAGVKPLPYWVDALVGAGNTYRNSQDILAKGEILFGFPSATLSSWSAEQKRDFAPLNEVQKNFVLKALNQIESLIDVKFRLVSDFSQKGVLTFANAYQQSDVGGYAVGAPDDQVWGVFFNIITANAKAEIAAPKDGNFGAYTFLHEIAHALGLKHPFQKADSLGNVGAGPYLPTAEDTVDATLMAYASVARDVYPSKYTDLDIAALQYLYGPAIKSGSGAHQTGNNTYTLSTTSANFIWDGGGIDTLDASNANRRVVLSLEAGTDVNGKHSYFGSSPNALITAAGQITINIGTVIENAYGTTYDDVITGNSQDNFIWGNNGNDTLLGGDGDDELDGGLGDDSIDGGDGFDFASYTTVTSISGVVVDLQAGTATGGGGNDKLISIEAAWGTVNDDKFFGTSELDFFVGDKGDDFADGRSGTDYYQINNDISNCSWTFDGDTCVITTKDEGIDRLVNIERVYFVGASTVLRTIEELRASASTNRAPAFSASSQSVSLNEDASRSITLAATDADGDALTYSVSSAATKGTVSISGSTATYTPNKDYNGSDSFIVRASDGKGGTATQTINITVAAVNDAPTFSASSQSVSATAGTAKTITLAATDVDGDALTYTTATPSKGSATISGSTLTYTPSTSGTDSFLVTARDPSGATATQTINVTVAAGKPSGASSFEAEPNNNQADADPITSGSSITGQLLSRTDVDYFKFTATSASSVNLVLDAPTDWWGTNYFKVDLYNSSGTLLSSYATGRDATFSTAVQSAGTYYVSISAADGNYDGGNYKLTANVTGTGASSFEAEPNDNQADADPITSGSSITGQLLSRTDVDYFKFTATSASSVNLVLDAPTDWWGTNYFKVDLYNSSGTLLSSYATGRDATFSTAVQSAGTYYVSISAADGNYDGGNYKLTANVTGTGASSFEAEPNDNQADADPITSGSSITGQLLSRTDVDYFKFTATSASSVNLVLDAPTDWWGTNYFKVDLYNSSGTLLSSYATGRDATFSTAVQSAGTYYVSISAADGNYDGGNYKLTANFESTNRAPAFSASSQSVSLNEDASRSITLAATDADGDALTYSVSSAATKGTVSISGSTATYTPNKDYNGSDSFIVRASDGKGGTATQTINITVAAVNDAPTFSASSQSVSATAGTAKTITLAATDVDGDALTYTTATPSKGSATISGSTLTYTPSTSGTDSFLVTARDPSGATATQTINVTVDTSTTTTSTTDFRVTASDGWTGAIGGNGLVYGTSGYQDIKVLSGTVTFDASFNKGGDILRFDAAASSYTVARAGSSAQISAGSNLSAVIPVGTAGMVTSFLDGARKLVFANSNFALGAQTFSTSATTISAAADGTSLPTGASSSASARISLAGNDLRSGQTSHITIGGKAIIYGNAAKADVVAIASGVNVDLTFDASFNRGGDTIILDKSAGNFSAIRSGASIILTSTNQTLTIPVGTTSTTIKFADDSRTLVYSTSEAAIKLGTQTIATTSTAITPLNRNPAFSATSQSVSTNEDTAKTITVSATDADGDSLTYTVSTAAGKGTATVSGNAIIYTPNANYNGSDSFVVTASDGKGGTATQTVNVTVVAVNDAPSFASSTRAVSVNEDSILTLSGGASDVDGDTLTYSVITSPTKGTVSVSGSVITYIPNANYNGSDTLTIQVSDGKGATSTQTVSVNVVAVNDAPTFASASQAISASAGAAKTVTLSASDIDGDTLSYTVSTSPTNGTATISGTTLTYTPTANYNGADSLVVTVSDGKGGTATQTINATVTAAVTTSLDVGTSSSTTTVSGANGSVTFTDDATKSSYVRITNFSSDDIIRITGATEDKYSFTNADLDGDGQADDLSITFSNPDAGIVNDIQIINAVDPTAFVGDKATAISAVGFNFISFG